MCLLRQSEDMPSLLVGGYILRKESCRGVCSGFQGMHGLVFRKRNCRDDVDYVLATYHYELNC